MMNARPITTDDELETLRQIRNSGRQWMTRDTAEISSEQQRAWWEKRDPQTCLVFLFAESATDVGYGLLRLESDRWWCSLAVLPQFQRQGYGAAIYRWLALTVSGAVWAEIYADNTPSIRAALRAGYQLVHAADKTATLVYRK